MTIVGISIVLACGFGRVLLMVLKLFFKTLFIHVIRGCYYFSIWVIGRSLISIGFICSRAARLCRLLQSLCNSSEGTVTDAPVPQAINDNAAFRQLRDVEVIEAAAFRPRRRRTRNSQSPRRIV